MATLTKNAQRVYGLGAVSAHPAAVDIVYEGAAVGLNGGNARPLALGDEFAGFADKLTDNATGSVGDENVSVIASGKIELNVTGASASSVGLPVFATDDDSFSLTRAANAVMIGRVQRHESGTKVLVLFAASSLQATIADPTGGATTDAEARTAIGLIIDALEIKGIIRPV